MITDFISLEIDLQENTAQLHKSIEVELRKNGEPLRWAITAVDSESKKVTLEAVITKKQS